MQDNAGHNKEKRQKVRRMQDNAGEKNKNKDIAGHAGRCSLHIKMTKPGSSYTHKEACNKYKD